MRSFIEYCFYNLKIKFIHVHSCCRVISSPSLSLSLSLFFYIVRCGQNHVHVRLKHSHLCWFVSDSSSVDLHLSFWKVSAITVLLYTDICYRHFAKWNLWRTEDTILVKINHLLHCAWIETFELDKDKIISNHISSYDVNIHVRRNHPLLALAI